MKHLEHEFQCKVVKYLAENGIPCFSVPNHLLHNGLAESKREIAAGLRKGAPDIIAGNSGRSYWLELKTEVGRQSIEQKAFQQLAPWFGAQYVVVRKLEDLKCVINAKSQYPAEPVESRPK